MSTSTASATPELTTTPRSWPALAKRLADAWRDPIPATLMLNGPLESIAWQGDASVRDAVFSDLVPLPSIEPGVIARFRDRDDAWVNVAEGIVDVVRDLPAIQERAQAARERPVPETGLRVLFAAANPTGTARLNVGTELAAVRGRLAREGLDEGVAFFDERAVDLAELASALNRTRPQVVHFVGHSKHEGSIVLDGLAEAQAVSDEALRQLFLPLPQRPKLLLLNTCFAGQQGSVLESVVDCFIGHLDPIDDLAAVLFAEILYDGLLRGRSIRAAYDQAQAATHDRTRSVLRARDGIDPSKVTLVPYDPPSKS